MVYINVRDLQPSSKSVFKYRNGKESEAIHEVLDGSYYRKDLSENGVTNSYSKDGVITNTIERVLTPGGCMSAMTKIEQGEVKERIAFKCE